MIKGVLSYFCQGKGTIWPGVYLYICVCVCVCVYSSLIFSLRLGGSFLSVKARFSFPV